MICSETRCLENAHLIPMYLYRGAIPIFNKKVFKTVKLCPTHHKCFDTFRLNESEAKVLAPLVRENIWQLRQFIEKLDEIYSYHEDKPMLNIIIEKKKLALAHYLNKAKGYLNG